MGLVYISNFCGHLSKKYHAIFYWIMMIIGERVAVRQFKSWPIHGQDLERFAAPTKTHPDPRSCTWCCPRDHRHFIGISYSHLGRQVDAPWVEVSPTKISHQTKKTRKTCVYIFYLSYNWLIFTLSIIQLHYTFNLKRSRIPKFDQPCFIGPTRTRVVSCCR